MNDPAAALSPRLLDGIRGPADVKALAAAQLPQLAQEIRDEIIAVTSKNGGHVGPNLGVVELTIALHRVFTTPDDQFVFDVAHQGYVHKLLTGRGTASSSSKLRQSGGAQRFPLSSRESQHDSYGAGHAGTALSAALGMATARDLRGTHEHVVAVCGDAAFTCGITLEALNNVVSCTKRLIVILNDNEWSIAKNVGAISSYLNRLSTSPTYNKLHHDVEAFFRSFPAGVEMNRVYNKWKRETKDFFVESSLFEKFGLRYLGPVDGHNLDALVKNLEFAAHCDVPVLIHVLTKKGKGLGCRRQLPGEIPRRESLRSRDGRKQEGRARRVAQLPGYFWPGPRALRQGGSAHRRHHRRHAQRHGSFRISPPEAAREQFFDVGIAEEHAVLFAVPAWRPRAARAGRRHLLDVPAARLRADHPRRRPAKPPGDVLHGSRRTFAQRRADAPRRLRPVLPALRAQRDRNAAEGRGRIGGHAPHEPAAPRPNLHSLSTRQRAPEEKSRRSRRCCPSATPRFCATAPTS